VTNGAVTVSLAGGATISAGANGSSTLTLSGTQAQINAALANLSYQGNADFNGADTLTVLSTDANGATDADAVGITVSSVNDVPVNTVPGRADGQRRHFALDRRCQRQRRRRQPGHDAAERDQRLAQRQPGRRRDDQSRARTALRPSRCQARKRKSTPRWRASLTRATPISMARTPDDASTDANGATDSDDGGDHRQLGERRPGQHRAGRADRQRGHGAFDRRDLGQRRRRQPGDDPPDSDERRGDRQPGRRGDDQRGRQRLLEPDALRHSAQINAALASLAYQGNADFNGATR
jgi:hypothetical protein